MSTKAKDFDSDAWSKWTTLADTGFEDAVTASTTEGTLAIGFIYREVTFYVDSTWLAEHVDDWKTLYRKHERMSISPTESVGKVSSISDTLDMVWSQFRAEARGDMSIFHSLLGCYNLPRETLGTEFY